MVTFVDSTQNRIEDVNTIEINGLIVLKIAPFLVDLKANSITVGNVMMNS